MMPSKRIESGGRWILFGELIFYWGAYTALTIATAYYLWSDEDKEDYGKSVQCNDEYDSSDCTKNGICEEDDQVDVQKRFGDILRIYFALFVSNWALYTVLIFAAIAKSHKLARLVEGLSCCNCCLAIAALVILHVYRFQPSGKAASGDCLTDEQKEDIEDAWEKMRENGITPATGQYYRGRYLLGLVIYVWCGGFFLCCVSCIFMSIHTKKHG